MAFTRPPADKKYISLELTGKQHKTLTQLGKKQKMKTNTFAQNLFEAAFASAVGVQPNPDLDATLARVMLLWGIGQDDDLISRELGISKQLVQKIQSAWVDEVLGRAA